MSIYIIAHKEFEQPKIHGYKSLMVGNGKSHSFGDCFDNVGENISYKNKNYCELTGMYWIWKNCKDDYVGICHYRRYFSKSLCIDRIATENEFLCKLRKYDIIVPFARKLKMTVREQYCRNSGNEKDLDIVRNTLLKKYPDYVNDFDEVMEGKTVYFFNMLVTKKELYDNYCEWLFDILFDVEKQIDLSKYNLYQKRVFGFLGERLLNIWVRHNQLEIFEMGVVNTQEQWTLWKRMTTGVKRMLMYYLQF